MEPFHDVLLSGYQVKLDTDDGGVVVWSRIKARCLGDPLFFFSHRSSIRLGQLRRD